MSGRSDYGVLAGIAKYKYVFFAIIDKSDLKITYSMTRTINNSNEMVFFCAKCVFSLDIITINQTSIAYNIRLYSCT